MVGHLGDAASAVLVGGAAMLVGAVVGHLGGAITVAVSVGGAVIGHLGSDVSSRHSCRSGQCLPHLVSDDALERTPGQRDEFVHPAEGPTQNLCST